MTIFAYLAYLGPVHHTFKAESQIFIRSKYYNPQRYTCWYRSSAGCREDPKFRGPHVHIYKSCDYVTSIMTPELEVCYIVLLLLILKKKHWRFIVVYYFGCFLRIFTVYFCEVIYIVRFVYRITRCLYSWPRSDFSHRQVYMDKKNIHSLKIACICNSLWSKRIIRSEKGDGREYIVSGYQRVQVNSCCVNLRW